MRVIVLVHASLIPPDGVDYDDVVDKPYSTEFYVIDALKELKHEVLPVGLEDDLGVSQSCKRI
ncbi:MAG: hypothetical protein R2827_08380 [Bdellovibrionales bacterium]